MNNKTKYSNLETGTNEQIKYIINKIKSEFILNNPLLTLKSTLY